MATLTLLDDGRELSLDAEVAGDRVRLAPAVVERALGWRLEPYGLCRDDVCLPVRDRRALVVDGRLDLAALAGVLDRPLAVDGGEGIAALGGSAAERGARLASLEAPEFTLPDLAGRAHALHDYRGTKALLLAWAGW